jgi:hypothetical protein
VSREEIYQAFADDWEVEDVQSVTIENVTYQEGQPLSASGPMGWLATVVHKLDSLACD